MQVKPYIIGILAYHQVDLLDVAVPYELFNWMTTLEADPPGGVPRQVRLISVDGPRVTTRDGLPLGEALPTLAQAGPVDLLWVPGGAPARLAELMADLNFMLYLQGQSEHASYMVSVCEGALLLAAAGLLDGHRATTHWSFLGCLRKFPAVEVAAGYPRYVVDRQRITGGGISSGMDEALEVIALLGGEALARKVQRTVQYNPSPPFRDGDPAVAVPPLTSPPPCDDALSLAIDRLLRRKTAGYRAT
ncbi:MAG TPA: DJ-1/PfpI family protein [Burkholderiaceae bacterium]|nr:DJ-1/PfpI family protein [Burkholderiaceae bacterium]